MKIERTGRNAGNGAFGDLSGGNGPEGHFSNPITSKKGRFLEMLDNRHCDRSIAAIAEMRNEATRRLMERSVIIRWQLLQWSVIHNLALRPNGLLHCILSLSLQYSVRNDGYRSPALRPIPKNRHEENRVFTYFLLIFYCYLLILVNELRANQLKINRLKN